LWTEGATSGAEDYNRIIIVGGGCYGSYYLRQLLRGEAAGSISWKTISVVDRDSSCAVSSAPELSRGDIELVTAEWTEFFDRYLGDLAGSGSLPKDGIVPSPLMPHLMYDWLLGRARLRWPEREVATRPFQQPATFPWEREMPDGTRYISFATWTCPINCIEPRTCPHTRGPRDWSIPEALRTAMSAGADLKGPVIFHCTHRAYGVGMIDTADVVEADRFIAAEGAAGADVLIGTASHCHGALNVLSIPG
jgi:hypothetical protein